MFEVNFLKGTGQRLARTLLHSLAEMVDRELNPVNVPGVGAAGYRNPNPDLDDFFRIPGNRAGEQPEVFAERFNSPRQEQGGSVGDADAQGRWRLM